MKSSVENSGQAISFLAGQVKRNKFASSYLFTGQENDKKKELAIQFAKTLNCLENTLFEACDCVSCSKIETGNHPDIKWYGLDEDESSIKIEEMGDLQSWLSYKPYEGRVKVFILYDAERLTIEAQNALLKSLEEPPPASVMILLAKKRSDLLDTIVSRCLEIKVPSYSEDELIARLKKEGVSEPEACYLARESFGNLGKARKEHGSGYFRRKNEILDNVISNSASGFEPWGTRPRDEVLQLLALLLEWARDGGIYLSTGESEQIVHVDRMDLLKRFFRGKKIEEAVRLYEAIEETRKAVDDYVNVKLAMSRLQVLWNQFVTP